MITHLLLQAVSWTLKKCYMRDIRVHYTVTWFIDYIQGLDWWLDLCDSSIQYAITLYNSLLHIHTSVQSCLHLLLLCSGFQWQMFPFLWVPELSPASSTRFSQQQLTMTELQQFCDWLTQSLTNQTQLNCLSLTALLTSSWHRLHRKHHSIIGV
jgi:hypothetical protein